MPTHRLVLLSNKPRKCTPQSPPPNYEEELTAQKAITKKAKQEIYRIRKHAQKWEINLQQRLKAWTTEYTKALQDTEAKTTVAL